MDAKPGSPITVDEARDRDAVGEEYTAVVPRSGHPYPTLVTIVWKNDYCSTIFLDEYGRQAAKYVFKKMGDQLFLSRILMHTYPNKKRGLVVSDAVRMEDVKMRPDGYSKRVVTDDEKQERITDEYSDVPTDANWEPIPKFGEWDSIARFERSGRANA